MEEKLKAHIQRLHPLRGTRTRKEFIAFVVDQICLYGEDATAILLEHYSDRLEEEVARLLPRCQRCKGSGMLRADLRNHGNCEYETHIIGCLDCYGRGWRISEPNRVYTSTSMRNEQPYGHE